MGYQELSTGENPPHEVNVLIEIPKGEGAVKNEFDKASGFIFVDRLRQSSMSYPGNYGMIPHTLSEDGDALDVLVKCDEKIYPGSVIAVRVIGVLVMEDEKGLDEKIIAVPADSVTKRYSHIRDINHLDKAERDNFEHFFTHYKELDGKGKWSKVKHWGDVDEAHKIIEESMRRHDKKNGPPPCRPQPS